MRDIVVFEGIASSGKTTLEKILAERLGNATILSEEKSLMPIIDNEDKNIALQHLEVLLREVKERRNESFIIDRFHLTHAFRTGSRLGDFSEVENELANEGRVLMILLTIDPEHIKERIEEAALFRKDKWKKGAQGSIEEKETYYRRQQEILKSLLLQSTLPSLTIDTTDKAWEKYTDVILEELEKAHSE